MAKKRYSTSSSSGGGCGVLGCWLLIVIVNLTLGSYCFNYSLGAIWGTQLPWGLALIGGLFLGELTIPCAVICWLITLSGVAQPFIK